MRACPLPPSHRPLTYHPNQIAPCLQRLAFSMQLSRVQGPARAVKARVPGAFPAGVRRVTRQARSVAVAAGRARPE